MRHDVHIEELLSAYLADDVTPDERAQVERRLAIDSDFRERLSDLQNLVALLRQGERPVTAEMLADFRRRIEQHLCAPAGRAIFAHLVSCSVIGDLTETERSVLEIYLNQHPEARNEVVSLSAMSTFLKKGERKASATAPRTLAERLSAKIPAAALAPVLPEATETVKLQLQPAAGSGQPTIRVFVAQESPWRSRVRRMAALAALLALSTGAVLGVRALIRQNPSNTTLAKDTPPNANQEVPAPNLNAEQSPVERRLALGPIDRAHVPLSQDPQIQAPPIVPASAGGNGGNGGNEDVAPQDHNRTSQQIPETVVPKKQNTPRVTPNPYGGSGQQDSHIAPEDLKPTPTPEPKYPQPQNQSGPENGGGGAVLPPASVAEKKEEPKASDPLAPKDNVMLVAVMRDGQDQAQVATADGTGTIHLNQAIPSGSDITTGNTRLALILPEGGRLWIGAHTKVHVDLKGTNTHAKLNTGQIAYRAPAVGAMTLDDSTGVQVADADGLLDIKNDPDTKVFQTSVQTGKAKVLRNKSASKTVNPGIAAVVKPDAESITTLSLAALSGDRPDKWRDDLVVSGDNPDGTPKLGVTSHPDGRSKGKKKSPEQIPAN